MCDLFQKKDEVFEQITSEDNIIVCDLFQKKDQVFEQITPEDENEKEEPSKEYDLTRKEEPDRTGPAIGELGVHNTVELGAKGPWRKLGPIPNLIEDSLSFIRYSVGPLREGNHLRGRNMKL